MLLVLVRQPHGVGGEGVGGSCPPAPPPPPGFAYEVEEVSDTAAVNPKCTTFTTLTPDNRGSLYAHTTYDYNYYCYAQCREPLACIHMSRHACP